MSDQYEDLQQSYGRCLRDKRFIERFYEVFMASHPAIAPMFADAPKNCQFSTAWAQWLPNHESWTDR